MRLLPGLRSLCIALTLCATSHACRGSVGLQGGAMLTAHGAVQGKASNAKSKPVEAGTAGSGANASGEPTDAGKPTSNTGAPDASSMAGAGSGGGSASNASDAGTANTPPQKYVAEKCTAPVSKPMGSAPQLTEGTWKNISPSGVAFGVNGDNSVFTQGMALDPCNHSVVYVTVAGYNTKTFDTIPGGLYRSLDAGSTWSKIGPFDQPLQIRIDPKDPKHMYVGDGVRGGTIGFWVTKDGGDTWAVPDGFHQVSQSSLGGDTDVYHVEPDPTDFNHVLVSFHWYWDGCNSGCNSGVIESFDGGDHWTVHQPDPGWAGGGGYGVFFLFNPDMHVGDSKTWLYGSQGKGYWRTDNAGASWTQVTTNNMEHGGGQIYYSKKTGTVFAGGYPNMMRSTDNGKTWTTMGPTGGYVAMIGDGETLYTGIHDRDLSLLTSPESDGATWTDYNSQQFDGGPFEMAFDEINRIMYASSTSAGLWALKLKP